MLRICSFSMLEFCMRHCLYLYLCMGVRQLYGRRRGYRIRDVQMDNLRGLLGIRRMDRVPNARIRKLSGVRKGVHKRIDEGVLRWLGHVERMENDRNAKRVYVGECAGSRGSDGLIP